MPSKADIITAVKNANIFLKITELNGATVKLNSNGSPYLFTGGFTMVFHLTKGFSKWAFRVWHCGFNRQKERFQKISQYLVNKDLPYFADFIYDEKGLLVNGEFVDTIRMKWLDGDLLKNYIEKNINNPNELRLLADSFLEMFKSLHEENISHGDLQHGNILIDEHGNIQLIDYDSVCVPDIEGDEELVTGLIGYQHPSRLNNATKTSLKADYFSELIIYLSLCAIAENPNLWEEYNVIDTEVLLFNDSDLENILQSKIYKELSNSGSNTIKSLVKILVEYLFEKSYLNLEPFATHKDFIEWDIESELKPTVSKYCVHCGRKFFSSTPEIICEKCLLEENLKEKKEEAENIIIQAKQKCLENLTHTSEMAIVDVVVNLINIRAGNDIAAIDNAILEVKYAIKAAILKDPHVPHTTQGNLKSSGKNSWIWVFIILLSIILGPIIISKVLENRTVQSLQSTLNDQNSISNLNIEMIFVQGGTFTMGCTSCDDSWAKPAHKVTVSDFYIGKYEVTQAQWKAVMGTTVRQQRDKHNEKERLAGEGDNNPMYFVNWDEAQEFILRLNDATGIQYRLPTEAEWEYAARGGNISSGFEYSGSISVDYVAWYYANSEYKTHPVGKKAPNELGIYDMSGNVWEWCNDWYDSYNGNTQINPQGPSSSNLDYRVIRGGSWDVNETCFVYARGRSMPNLRNSNKGFRLAYSSTKIVDNEEQAWNTATQKNTLQSYRTYVSSYPQGKYLQTANKKIKELEEEQVWIIATQRNTPQSYRNYLSSYPRGKYTTTANNKIIELEGKQPEEQKRQLLSEASRLFDAGRYDEAFTKYKEIKVVDANDTTGYVKFLGKSKELMSILGDCDTTVKKMLNYARELNNTSEVNNLLSKCNQ